MADDQVGMHVAVSVPVNIDQAEVLREAARVVVRKVFPPVETDAQARAQVKSEVVQYVRDHMSGWVSTGTIYVPKSEVVQYVRDHIAGVLTDVTAQIEQMTFPQTNSYGESTGKTRTIREFIGGQVDAWFCAKVDQYGHPGGGMTRADHMIKKAVEEYVTKELKAKIDATVLGAVTAVEANLAKYVAEALSKTVGLKK